MRNSVFLGALAASLHTTQAVNMNPQPIVQAHLGQQDQTAMFAQAFAEAAIGAQPEEGELNMIDKLKTAGESLQNEVSSGKQERLEALDAEIDETLDQAVKFARTAMYSIPGLQGMMLAGDVTKLILEYAWEHTSDETKRVLGNSFTQQVAGRIEAFKLWMTEAFTGQPNIYFVMGDYEDYLATFSPGSIGERLTLSEFFHALRANADEGSWADYQNVMRAYGQKAERPNYMQIRVKGRNSSLQAMYDRTEYVIAALEKNIATHILTHKNCAHATSKKDTQGHHTVFATTFNCLNTIVIQDVTKDGAKTVTQKDENPISKSLLPGQLQALAEIIATTFDDKNKLVVDVEKLKFLAAMDVKPVLVDKDDPIWKGYVEGTPPFVSFVEDIASSVFAILGAQTDAEGSEESLDAIL